MLIEISLPHFSSFDGWNGGYLMFLACACKSESVFYKISHITSFVNCVVLMHENIILLYNNCNVIYLISR
jgi:hypothetical protein